ncbi:MAG TPA: hypothetical protein ENJ94_00620 [Gammaproteobacteria bacterium]|nr:hypothetical protein [Gammaproteobacteria bacterium]
MPTLTQLHIDVARNATDDFNPFHDPLRWQNIRDNPFGGPIALGFQLEALALHAVAEHRAARGEPDPLAADGPPFSRLRFSFAGAVRPGDRLEVQVRDTRPSGGGLGNRVLIRQAGGGLVLSGSRSDFDEAPPELAQGHGLPFDPTALPDRELSPDGRWFHKRKYLMTSNGKNFCAAAGIPQHHYFDELAERVRFPPAYTLALVSCALLERARHQGHDFEAQPFVYTAHQFEIDNRLQRRLRSNDRLHLLAGPQQGEPDEEGDGHPPRRVIQQCLGILEDGRLLFRGRVTLAPLAAILATR